METMRIGEFAGAAGVNVQTVRYYERRGLLPEPERRASGYREYGPECLQRLRFILRAKELGLTLSEVEAMLALRQDADTTAAQVKARAEEKLADVAAKIRDLERIRQALSHLIEGCEGGEARLSDCPLLDALGPLEGASCSHD